MKSENPSRRTYLKLLGNPYAYIEEELEEKLEITKPKERVDFENRNTHIKTKRHPYEFIQFEEDLDENENTKVSTTEQVNKLQNVRRVSKEDFRKRCRIIFQHYIPSIERGRLRRHHQEFISRNESRSPEDRYLILSQLQKYDLSNIPGINTQFNRERDVFTEEKLSAIEFTLLVAKK